MTNFQKNFPEYLYDPDQQVFYNKEKKKIFSQNYIFEHSYEDVRANDKELSDKGWKFYFNRPPSADAAREFLKTLET
jgi:hypothetical protein